MAKPIFITRVPFGMDEKVYPKIQSAYTDIGIEQEYYVLVLKDSSLEAIQFEVLNVQDVTPINFKELKEKLEATWQDNTE